MPKKKPEKKVSEEDAKLLGELKRLMREGLKTVWRGELEEAKKLFEEGEKKALEVGWDEDATVFKASRFLIDQRSQDVVKLLAPVVENPKLRLRGYAYERLGNAEELLGHHHQAIAFYQEALGDPNYDTPGYVWNYMGLTYVKKGEFNKAIECYRKALDVPGYDTRGKAWNNMGNAYAAKGEFDKAIECLNNALNSEDYDTPGHALNNLGNVYHNKGEYDKAIECFNKALGTENFDMPGNTWNNMGVVYVAKGDYDEAIECYNKALESPEYKMQGNTWLNIGLAFSWKKEFGEALKWMEKARDWFSNKQPGMVYQAEYLINSIKRQQELTKRSLDEAAREVQKLTSMVTPKKAISYPEEDPIDRIREILDENRNRVAEHATQEGTRYKDVLAVLKGWSSSIPIVSAVDRERFSGQVCQGGGYFIKAGKQGIVIDPGLDFVTNFGTNGEIKGSDVTKMRTGKKTKPRNFHIKEITQVVVSHHHIDHYVDITRINDLDHQLRNYDVKAKEREPLHYYFDSVTYKNHSLSEVSNDNIHPIDPSQPQYSLQGDVKIYPFPTQHRCQSSFGCVLEVKLAKGGKRRIGYTSDMSLFKQSLPEELNNCDIIIAHFSYAEPDDFAGKKEDDNHLGYTGLKKLIQGTSAELYIISEFWGGKGDYRIELAQKLRYDLKREGREVKIIPGDVGCLIGLRELDIRCSRCGMWVPSEEIFVTAPEVPFGKLRYLCKNCLLG
ncbi:MAG: tetratricopeptide repeat protein [Candidatus Stahlbacteria bacterium]|nr:MAG: tetratricopeptide repeat protein [Candidatus Stahlbacteria bacterium]